MNRRPSLHSSAALLLVLTLLAGALTGCIREDLSHCPPETEGVMRIRFNFLLKKQKSGDKENGPTSEVYRADIYLFDTQERFVAHLSDTEGPFGEDYRLEAKLPAGSYTAVAWMNSDAEELEMTSGFIPGQTTLREATLRLRGLPLKTAITRPLFHGMKENVLIEAGKNAEAIIPIIRNTKEIRLGVRFKHADGTPCTVPDHRKGLKPWLQTTEGELDFLNAIHPQPLFRYAPREHSETDNGFDARFTLLRLVQASDVHIQLATPGIDGGGETLHFSRLLTDYIRATGAYPTQESLDREESFEILLEFTCHPGSPDDTWLQVKVTIEGWVFVDNGDQGLIVQ
ncbi:FimB/Mfa2 family fimbrial subunit [Parabacteroides gordonii]|uniref:FimB/Mfa2 family fimbrial subunit n=1 Tax=Parabacteroides gordonii TaxID=574930 RepID=UPI0026EDCB5E|nr:FimB/Mfa2 family fimbrial subunit [Parabacteroides gordonii]